MKNIIQKIWDAHVVHSQPGHPDVFAIDLQLIHEVTSPQAFAELRARKLSVHAPERCVATVDHIVSTAPNRQTVVAPQVEALRKNCRDFGVKLLDMGSGRQGIVHVIGPELGLVQPGMTVVCGDSHTSTHGAFGAIAFGIGSSEVGHVLATGCMLQQRPKTMKVHFRGMTSKHVTAKDMILKLIQQIGIAGGTGYILEYTGDVIRSLYPEERMTICNMSIECGARAGLIAPDEMTFEYLRSSQSVVRSSEQIEHWKSLASDLGATYDAEVEVDVGDLAPMVTWGVNPAQSVAIDQPIPDPETLKGAAADLARKAMEYTKLTPGQSMEGVPIDYVFIGSCTNGRISDLRAAAQIMKGKKVAKGVTVIIAPGSEAVRAQAIAEGLDKIFSDAGADFRQPGCSMCIAMNGDAVSPGKRCASTSNRNFIGRQGLGSITHLMSPPMAALAAMDGRITDVRKRD